MKEKFVCYCFLIMVFCMEKVDDKFMVELREISENGDIKRMYL